MAASAYKSIVKIEKYAKKYIRIYNILANLTAVSKISKKYCFQN